MRVVRIVLASVVLLCGKASARQFIGSQITYPNSPTPPSWDSISDDNNRYVLQPDFVRTSVDWCCWDYIQSHGWGYCDAIIATNVARGYKILWEASDAYSLTNRTWPEMLVTWSNYLSQVAARYHPWIIEVYNEPWYNQQCCGGKDINEFATNYVSLYGRCYDAIKAASPNTLVAGPTFSTATYHEADVLRKVMAAFRRRFDALTFHDYRNCGDKAPNSRLLPPEDDSCGNSGYHYPYCRLDQILDIYKAWFPNTPIIVSEWGHCAGDGRGGGDSQLDCSRAARFVTMYRGGGVTGLLPWTIPYGSSQPSMAGFRNVFARPGQNATLLPWKKTLAIFAAANWLNDATDLVKTNLGGEVFIYAWRVKGTTITCFWTKEGVMRHSARRTVSDLFRHKYNTSIVREHPQYLSFLLKTPKQALVSLAEELK